MAVSARMQALIDKIDAADAAHFSDLRELAGKYITSFRLRAAA